MTLEDSVMVSQRRLPGMGTEYLLQYNLSARGVVTDYALEATNIRITSYTVERVFSNIKEQVERDLMQYLEEHHSNGDGPSVYVSPHLRSNFIIASPTIMARLRRVLADPRMGF